LLAKSEDYRDRDLIRQLRCEVEEKKRRCRELLSEAANLRKDRDMIKLDKGDLQINH
jgi:FtsZ-binding cell division protein ZapB